MVPLRVPYEEGPVYHLSRRRYSDGPATITEDRTTSFVPSQALEALSSGTSSSPEEG